MKETKPYWYHNTAFSMEPYFACLHFPNLLIVGSVKVNFLSYHYKEDKSTIFGMRGLRGLTINSGRGARLKYLKDGRKSPKKKNGHLYRQKSDFLSF